MDAVTWITSNMGNLAFGLNAILTLSIAIFMWVPGDEPEKTLQKIIDVVKNFSKK